MAEFSGVSVAAALAHMAQQQLSPHTGTDAISSGLSGALASQPALVFGFSFGFTAPPGLAAGTGFTALSAVWDYSLGLGSFAKPEWRRVLATTSLAATFTDATNAANSDAYQTYLLAFAESALAADPLFFGAEA